MKWQIKTVLIAGLVLNTISSLVQADILKDIQAGISPQKAVQIALNAGLVPAKIISQLMAAGVNPITSASVIANALPNQAVHIATTVVLTKIASCKLIKAQEKYHSCIAEVAHIAIGVADAVAEIVPEQRDAIINAVAKITPEPAKVIATFYPDPTNRGAHTAFTYQESTVTIPSPPALSQTIDCDSLKITDCVSPH